MKEIDNKKTVGHNPIASYTGDGILNVCLEYEDVVDAYIQSVYDHMTDFAEKAKKYDIMSEEFYNYMAVAFMDGYCAMRKLAAAGYSDDYIEEKIEYAWWDFFISFIAHLTLKCRKVRFKAKPTDIESDFEMLATGAYPYIFAGKDKTIFVGLVKKGRISEGETVFFPDGTCDRIFSVDMSGENEEECSECQAGELVCITVNGDHFYDFEYGTIITKRQH